MMRLARQTCLGIVVSVPLVACGGGDSNSPQPSPSFVYTVPADVGDGWQVADLATEGFDLQQITEMMGGIVRGSYGSIDSIAIVRNEKLLLYWFAERELDQHDIRANNRDPERHILHSTSKSVTSALIGIAIDHGDIPSVEAPFYALFDYSDYQNWSPRKADMTLEDVLTMRLGLAWDEWSAPYGSSANDLSALQNNNTDWPKALLDLPMSHIPGTVFAYNTAASIALGQVLESSTDMPMQVFANSRLFYPMLITDALWLTTPTGLANGGSGLFLKTRDLVKFGQLYLSGGSWQGQQLVSADWVADSIVPRVDLSSISTRSTAYGFQWWLDQLPYNEQNVESWTTKGLGGQYVFVIPSLNLVVAFTGSNYEDTSYIDSLYAIMRLYILRAID